MSWSICILGICFREATGAQRETVITRGHTDAKCQKWELNLSLSGFTFLPWSTVNKHTKENIPYH